MLLQVLRDPRAGMTGNWSLGSEEWPRRTLPDFCVGFLSITTPGVAGQLVQAALRLYSQTEVEQIEDSLITGILRERLPHIRLEMLQTRWWEPLTTCCSWINFFKSTFFNSLVLTKHSSRAGVRYVGPVTDTRVWRFFLCMHFEGVLALMESWMPGLLPSLVWQLCAR